MGEYNQGSKGDVRLEFDEFVTHLRKICGSNEQFAWLGAEDDEGGDFGDIDPDAEPKGELLRGWRVFTMLPEYRLSGSYGSEWNGRVELARCAIELRLNPRSISAFVDMLRSIGIEPPPLEEKLAERAIAHLSSGKCTCGIYSHVTRPEYLNYFTSSCSLRIAELMPDFCANAPTLNQTNVNIAATALSHGIVVPYEYGYRAEKCTLERLWLVRPRKCRSGHRQRLSKDTLTWTCEDIEDHAEVAAMSLSLNYGIPCSVVDLLPFMAELEESNGSR